MKQWLIVNRRAVGVALLVGAATAVDQLGVLPLGLVQLVAQLLGGKP